MNDETPDTELDVLIRSACAARPEPLAIGGLANLARARARVADAGLADRARRMQRLNGLVGVVAAAMIVVVLLLGGIAASKAGLGRELSGDDRTGVAANETALSGSSEAAGLLSRPDVLLSLELLVAGLVLISAAGPVLGRPRINPNELVFH